MRAAFRLLCALVCLDASAQSLRVYSEFAKINAFGDVTAPANPREILSPAIVRNGFTSFQVVVKIAAGTKYKLYIGENPEDALKVTLYRISSSAQSGARMEQVSYPVEGSASQVFWMDVWADRDAPVRRVKIEPQLNVGQDWVTYPMEVRVVEAVVPDGDRSVVTEFWPQQRYCGSIDVAPTRGRSDATSAELATARNWAQDLLLSKKASDSEMIKLLGDCRPHGDDPEWYLRIRDYLFRMR